jgi:hypothetical protein
VELQCLPAPHALHSLTLRPPGALRKVPRGQGVGKMLPGGQYAPAGHTGGVMVPVPLQYRPSWQLKQLACPYSALLWPGGHGMGAALPATV